MISREKSIILGYLEYCIILNKIVCYIISFIIHHRVFFMSNTDMLWLYKYKFSLGFKNQIAKL